MNGGIINSITKLHFVDISTESSTMHGSMNFKFINAKQAIDIQAYHSLELLMISSVPLETC
jgi:hypothetical protein